MLSNEIKQVSLLHWITLLNLLEHPTDWHEKKTQVIIKFCYRKHHFTKANPSSVIIESESFISTPDTVLLKLLRDHCVSQLVMKFRKE